MQLCTSPKCRLSSRSLEDLEAWAATSDHLALEAISVDLAFRSPAKRHDLPEGAPLKTGEGGQEAQVQICSSRRSRIRVFKIKVPFREKEATLGKEGKEEKSATGRMCGPDQALWMVSHHRRRVERIVRNVLRVLLVQLVLLSQLVIKVTIQKTRRNGDPLATKLGDNRSDRHLLSVRQHLRRDIVLLYVT
jgi:hypothetical protein